MTTLYNLPGNNGTHKVTESHTDYQVYVEDQYACACILDAEWYAANPKTLTVEMFEQFAYQDFIIAQEIGYTIYGRPYTFEEVMREIYRAKPDRMPSVYESSIKDIYHIHEKSNLTEWKRENVYDFAHARTLDYIANWVIEQRAKGSNPKFITQNLLKSITKVEQASKSLSWSIDDVMENQPADWIVDGLIEASDSFLMYGESGIGKTWFMMMLGVHTALGTNFLNYKCNQAHVFYIDQENRRKRFKRRLKSIVLHLATLYKVDAHDLVAEVMTHFHFICMPNPPIAGNDPNSIKMLTDAVNQYVGNKLIIIDNLGSISKVKDMNGSEMQNVMSGLLHLIELTGAALCSIHHKPKKEDSMYGSQYIKASIDFAINMTSMRGYKNAQGDVYGDHVVKISSGKARDEEAGAVLAELMIDKWVDRYAINPRFVLLNDSYKEQLKSTANKRQDARKWVSLNKELLLELSKNKAVQVIITNTGLYEKGSRALLESLIAQGVYTLTGNSKNDPNSKLIAGSNYDGLG